MSELIKVWGNSMEIKFRKKGMILSIEIAGRLDTSAPKDFETRLLELIERGETQLIFDFSQVEKVSSNGLRVLLRAFKQLTYANGRMAFHSLNDQVKRIFEIAGLTMVFSVYETREEAVASVLRTRMLPVNVLENFNRSVNQTAGGRDV